MRFYRLLLVVLILISVLSAQRKTGSSASSSKPAIDSQLYRNSPFGFRYRIPYGWVDRTKEMKEQDKQEDGSQTLEGPKNQAGKSEPTNAESTSDVLLAVFERPPEASADTVNSSVVIATESASSYPGLKGADDYLDQLDEITTAKGFKPDGDPQDVTVDSRALVRADFAKALNDKLTMYQSTLILLAKKQIVSFTFIAGSKDEIEELMDGLSFLASPAPKRP